MRRRDFLARLSAAPVIGAMIDAVASAKATEAPGGPRLYVLDEKPKGPGGPRWGEWDEFWQTPKRPIMDTPQQVTSNLLDRMCTALQGQQAGVAEPIPRDRWVIGLYRQDKRMSCVCEDARSPRAKQITAGRLVYSAGDPIEVLTDHEGGARPHENRPELLRGYTQSFWTNRLSKAAWLDRQMAHVMAVVGWEAIMDGSKPSDLAFHFGRKDISNSTHEGVRFMNGWSSYSMMSFHRQWPPKSSYGSWGDKTTSTPLADFRRVQAMHRGYSSPIQ